MVTEEPIEDQPIGTKQRPQHPQHPKRPQHLVDQTTRTAPLPAAAEMLHMQKDRAHSQSLVRYI